MAFIVATTRRRRMLVLAISHTVNSLNENVQINNGTPGLCEPLHLLLIINMNTLLCSYDEVSGRISWEV